MKPIEPIHTVELFPALAQLLRSVLLDLTPPEWNAPTVCGEWTVKDVAAHLLGGSLGRLQSVGMSAGGLITRPLGFAELTDLINRKNAEWVDAARRISPTLMVEFLEISDRHLDDYFLSLPPDAPSAISVAWANDEPAPNWFDLSREYTEKWLHQQHIRMATGRPLLLAREWLHPVLATFIRALPRTYRWVDAPDNTSVALAISGPAGGTWTVMREHGSWSLFDGCPSTPTARLELEQDLAWRLFTRSLTPEQVRPQTQITGSTDLGLQVLNTIAIMA